MGLLFIPPHDMSMESHGGMILRGEKPKNSEKKVPQYHFVQHKSHMD
jgi:hypothetical protein